MSEIEQGHISSKEGIDVLGPRNKNQSRDSYSLPEFTNSRGVDMDEPSVQNIVNESAVALTSSSQEGVPDDNRTESVEMNIEDNGDKREGIYSLTADTVNPTIKTDTFMRYAHCFPSDLDVVPTVQDSAEMDIAVPTDTPMPISSSEVRGDTNIAQNLQDKIFDEEIPVANNEIIIGFESANTDKHYTDLSPTESQNGSLPDENTATDEISEEKSNSINCKINVNQGTKRKFVDDLPEFDSDDSATHFNNEFCGKNRIDDPVSHGAQKIVKKSRLREREDRIASFPFKNIEESTPKYSENDYIYDNIPLATLLELFPDGKIKYPIVRCSDVRNLKGFNGDEGSFKVHEQLESGKVIPKLNDADILKKHEKEMFPHGVKYLIIKLVDLKDTAVKKSGKVMHGNALESSQVQSKTKNKHSNKRCFNTPVVAFRAQKELVKSKRLAALKRKVRRTMRATQTLGDRVKDIMTETVNSGSVPNTSKREETTEPAVHRTTGLPVPEPFHSSGVTYREPNWGGTGEIGTGIGEGDLSQIGKVNLHAPIPVSRLLPSYTQNDPHDYSKPPCWLQRFLDETKRREEWKMRHLITFQRDFICLESERIIKLEKIFQAILKPKERV